MNSTDKFVRDLIVQPLFIAEPMAQSYIHEENDGETKLFTNRNNIMSVTEYNTKQQFKIIFQETTSDKT